MFYKNGRKQRKTKYKNNQTEIATTVSIATEKIYQIFQSNNIKGRTKENENKKRSMPLQCLLVQQPGKYMRTKC